MLAGIHESESAEGPHFLACLLGPLVDRACFCLACSAKFRARFYDLLQDLVSRNLQKTLLLGRRLNTRHSKARKPSLCPCADPFRRCLEDHISRAGLRLSSWLCLLRLFGHLNPDSASGSWQKTTEALLSTAGDMSLLQSLMIVHVLA